MADARLSYEIDAKDRGAASTFKKVGSAAKGAKKDLEETSHGAKTLTRQIDETKDSLTRLHKEFERTGDKKFLKDIRKGEKDLKNLQGWAERFPGEVGKSTSALGKLSGALGNMPVMVPAVAVAGLAAIPAAAAVAGLALAGVGLGFVGMGAMAVRNSAMVQGELRDLSDEAVAMFTRAGQSMEKPIARSLNVLRGTVKAVGPDLTDMFKSVSPHVVGLARGVDQLARNAMPGLKEAAAGAGEVLDKLADKLPQTGTALSSFFSSLGASSSGGATALGAVLGMANTQIVLLGEGLEKSSKGLDFFTNGAGRFVSGFAGAYIPVLAATDESQRKAASAAEKYAEELNKVRNAALDAASAAFDLIDAQMALNGGMVSAERAAIAVTRGLDALSESVKDNGKSLDVNTLKGAANRSSILDIVDASNRQFQANTKNGMSVAAATKIHDRNTGALLANADKLGLNREQVWSLIQAINKVPPSKYSQIGVPGAVQSTDTVKNLKSRIDALKGKEVKAIARGDWSEVVRLRREINSLQNRQIWVTVTTQRRNASGSANAAEAYGRSGGLVGSLPMKRFAGGGFTGMVSAPGTTTSDSAQIRVSNREFVTKATSVAKIGVRNMEFMNRTGKIPGGSAAGGGGSETILAPVQLMLDGRIVAESLIRFEKRNGTWWRSA